LENRGVEDVEAEIDRIQQELMDPRIHPERLEAAIGAANGMMSGGGPAPMGGTTGAMAPPEMMNDAMTASAVPQ
jgi:hypothetical protein